MSSQAMELRSLLLSIARALVDVPEEVSLEVSEAEGLITLRLRVSWLDMGKVVGKQGRTARSMRTVLLAAANKLGVRCQLDIVQNVT